MPLAVWFFFAKSSCLAILPSTFASSLLPASAALCPPLALATTATVLADSPSASNAAAPPALMFFAPVASTTSSTRATPTAAPMAALPPTALPLAVVVLADFCWARTFRFPVISRSLPMRALVLLLTMAVADAGVSAMPPSAPASAVVDVLYWPDASSPTLPASFKLAPATMSAAVRLATTLTAADAPMPTLSPVVDSAGLALTVEEVLPRACSETSPLPSMPINDAPCASRAAVDMSTAFTPSAPARPTLLAPAPETALVVKALLAASGARPADTDRLCAPSA